MILLHIVIPTFNRSSKLEKTLSAIQDILIEHRVTVFDNFSTDNTSNVCRAFESKFSNFSYVRRTVNIGGNGNILSALIAGVELGDMLWVLADDDEIDPGGVSGLLLFLKSLSADEIPDALVVGACSTRAQPGKWPIPHPLDFEAGKGEFWAHASFLPTLIFSVHSLKISIDKDLFYIGGCYSQLLYMRNLLNANSKTVFLDERVIYRGEEETVHPATAWFIISWIKAVNTFPEQFRAKLISSVLGTFWTLPVRFAVHAGAEDSNLSSLTAVNYFDLLSLFKGWRRGYILAFLPICCLPKSMMRFLKSARGRGVYSKKAPTDGRL